MRYVFRGMGVIVLSMALMVTAVPAGVFKVRAATAMNDNGLLNSGSTKTPGRGNPLMDHKFGADPCAMSYNGRVYVYMTNDNQQYETTEKDANGYPVSSNNYGNIATINVISSDDLVNWVDHGEIPVAGKNSTKDPNGIAKWANNSWAPTICHKKINGKEKFFLYFADNANGIGVLEADSPIGPFKEPATGSQLIKWGMQAADGVVWLFDPAVLVDDDGTGYLYYGGGTPGSPATQEQKNNPGTARVIKLKDNMVEIDGYAKAIDAPAIFEDSGIHKYNGKYYYSYCSNFSNTVAKTGTGNICVMESSSPMGPFTYVGKVFNNPSTFFGIGGNNHHAFFDFNGKTYFTYHAQTLTKALGFPDNQQGYRSTHMEEVSYDSSGHINTITGTWGGVSQVKNLNPYVRTEAETLGWSKGINTAECSETGFFVNSLNMKVVNIQSGDWTAVSKADLGTGAKTFAVKAAGLSGGTIEVRLDGIGGTKIGEVTIPSGNGSTWGEYSCTLSGGTGVHNLYFVFKGSSNKLFELDYWKFSKDSSSEIITNGGFENDLASWDSHESSELGLGYYTVQSGGRSLKIKNRTKTASGAVQNVTGKLEKGKTYKVTASVRYNSSENASATGETTFHMSIIYGNNVIRNMATVSTKSDQWAAMEGTYTVPDDADLSNVRIFMETAYKSSPQAQDLVTFFVDDVSVQSMDSESVELVENPGFESDLASWNSYVSGELGLGYYTLHSGARSLKVKNRTSTVSGAVQDMTGKLEQGKTYAVSAAVRYNSSENATATGKTTFHISIIYGNNVIQNMATVSTETDQWAVMEGTYTVPGDADLSNVRIFLETAYTSSPKAQDLVTFFVDDVSIKKICNR